VTEVAFNVLTFSVAMVATPTTFKSLVLLIPKTFSPEAVPTPLIKILAPLSSSYTKSPVTFKLPDTLKSLVTVAAPPTKNPPGLKVATPTPPAEMLT